MNNQKDVIELKKETLEVIAQNKIKIVNKKFAIPNQFKQLKIDVGLSENAPQSQMWLEHDEDLFVIGFEPVLDNINNIRSENSNWPIKLKQEYIDTRLLIIPVALGNPIIPTSAEFYVTEDDPGCSSLLQPSFFKVKKKIKVDLFKLDDFLPFIPLENYSFGITHLKIDSQGYELEILKG